MATSALNPVQQILKNSEKKYNMVVGPMDVVAKDVKALSTGNIAIDAALGVNGFPMRRSGELFGPPSCGKTTTALMMCVEMQRVIISGGDPDRGIGPDDYILYHDYEQTLDKDYATALGLDLNHPSFLYTPSETLEDGANLTLELLKTGMLRLTVFDSVSGMNPKVRSEGEIGDNRPGLQARLLKEFGVNLNAVLREHNGMVVFINHETEKFDMGAARRPGMPAPTTTPGGVALKFFASVRIQYRQIKQTRGPWTDPLTGEVLEIPLSTDVAVKIVKNKVAPPFRQAVVRVRFGRGFDNFWTAMQILLANKKIMHEGAMYYFHNVAEAGFAPDWMKRATTGTNRPYIRGESSVFEMADEHPEWREGLIAMAQDIAIKNIAAAKAGAQTTVEEDESEEAFDQEVEELETNLSSAKGNRVKL